MGQKARAKAFATPSHYGLFHHRRLGGFQASALPGVTGPNLAPAFFLDGFAFAVYQEKWVPVSQVPHGHRAPT